MRVYHSAGVIRSSPDLVEVLLFGGKREATKGGAHIAETSLLKFGNWLANKTLL